MSETIYLKRLFQAYYNEQKSKIPVVHLHDKREFGFIPWEKPIMIRHIGFENSDEFLQYLIKNAPRHVYSSGSLYSQPGNSNMNNKGYLGCDFIIDIDVDHFDTPCKEDHDLWYCKECGKEGKGLPPKKCPKCKKLRFTHISWICEKCLNIAKEEIIKLINNFLIPDFGYNESNFNIAFSGHRGYHLKVEDDRIRQLSSENRREIVDYLMGHNVSLEILGLREYSQNIYGLLKENVGWEKKIILKLEDMLTNSTPLEIEHLLIKFGLNKNIIKSFIHSKDDFLETISKNERNLWIIPNFTLKTWKKFLSGIVKEIGAEIDRPVSVDIHRLIRYPGTLHGKTGFKVQELTLKELYTFNPLNQSDNLLDPVVFKSKNTQKLEIIEKKVPLINIKGDKFGPYIQGERIEVPHHIAVLFLCKGVAKTI